MATLLTWTTQNGNTYTITDDLFCNDDELYMTDTRGNVSGQGERGGSATTYSSTASLGQLSPYFTHRACLVVGSVFPSGDDIFTQTYSVSNWESRINWSYVWQTAGYDENIGTNTNYSGPSVFSNGNATGSTNVPVFLTDEDANAYLTATSDSAALLALKNAINYKDEQVEEPTDEVTLYSFGVVQTWDESGLIYENDSSGVAIHKGIRGKLKSGTMSLYPISGVSDGSLKYGIKKSSDLEWLYLEEVDGYTYSWTPVDEMSITFLYRKRFNEYGTFHASKIALDTNAEYNAKIPIFEDEETAQGYIDGDVDITSATNWATISKNYPIANGTGDGDDETEFGTVRAKNFFSQTYICSSSAIQEISNALFDTDATGITHLWEKIKEGVAMYGQDPMQVVQGLMFFPVVLSDVFTEWNSQQYVYFGGYKLDLQSGVKKLNFPNGYKSIGHITIKKSFNNWRDYEPFSKLYVYLPYVGTYQLSLERYYNKDTEVRYYIDIRTGGCVACLIADGLLMDYFNGQMGVQMPITLTDKNNYANSQIQTLLGGVQREGNTLTGAANVYGMSNAYVAAAAGTAGTMLNAYRTTYELSQNNINNFNKTRGGSTSMLNEYLPQYVTFMFEIQQDDPTANHDMLIGQPSNASGNLGDFSGYLEVETVNLNCGIATQNEKNKILSMLHNGIYI